MAPGVNGVNPAGFGENTDGAPFIRICASRELDLLAERAAGIAIGDRSLREIFDKQLYDGESLCILDVAPVAEPQKVRPGNVLFVHEIQQIPAFHRGQGAGRL